MILEDGMVSRAEMEGAYQDAVDCLEESGYVEVFFERESDRVYTIQGSSGAPEPGESETEQEARIDLGWDSCLGEYVGSVGDAWLRQTELSEEEKLVAAAALNDCIRPFGVEISGADVEGLRPLIEKLIELEGGAEAADQDALVLNRCYDEFLLVAGGSPSVAGSE
ncbi:MAG: hypothetical protein GY745_03510 [Actinomycetia bacterium]|nr:hypothetical protein [Actinomycetes bacterium]